jgi:hypothetical protein
MLKFDGEGVPRWVTDTLVRVDKDKDSILQEIQQEEEQASQGEGGGDEGSLEDLMSLFG